MRFHFYETQLNDPPWFERKIELPSHSKENKSLPLPLPLIIFQSSFFSFQQHIFIKYRFHVQ